jgi:hypothetical protein
MPVLLWVSFWSIMMGTAASFGDASPPMPAKLPKRLD